MILSSRIKLDTTLQTLLFGLLAVCLMFSATGLTIVLLVALMAWQAMTAIHWARKYHHNRWAGFWTLPIVGGILYLSLIVIVLLAFPKHMGFYVVFYATFFPLILFPMFYVLWFLGYTWLDFFRWYRRPKSFWDL